MSTYWGYVCQSHDPELISERWFNHGEDHLRWVYAAMRGGTYPKDRWGDYLGTDHLGYTTAAPAYWLAEHPRCTVALRNEYGEVESLEPQPSDNRPT